MSLFKRIHSGVEILSIENYFQTNRFKLQLINVIVSENSTVSLCFPSILRFNFDWIKLIVNILITADLVLFCDIKKILFRLDAIVGYVLLLTWKSHFLSLPHKHKVDFYTPCLIVDAQVDTLWKHQDLLNSKFPHMQGILNSPTRPE